MTTKCLEAPFTRVAPQKSSGRGESSEAYPCVTARLTPKLRVIDDLSCQWCIQARKSPTRWESFAFCATKAGLLLRIKEHLQAPDKIAPLDDLAGRYCYPAAWKLVAELPDYYPKDCKC